MITRVKGSSFRTQDNFNYISLGDVALVNTDVTAAIVTALATGKPLYIPVGIWIIGSLSIPSNSYIFGDGSGSVLKIKDLNNANGLSISGTTGVTLKDFAIDGNKVNQVGTGFNAVDIASGSAVRLQGISISNCKGSGIGISGTATDVFSSNCSVSGYTESGFKIAGGSNISLIHSRAQTSDVAATGDGIAIASSGLTVSSVNIASPMCFGNVGRGIAIVGNGSKNVIGVSITNPRVTGNSSHGIHLVNADACSITAGNIVSNGGDGIRIEGDVQNCRVIGSNLRSNTSFGIREVISGSTPNFNGLIYTIVALNGNNTITKVGASSYIV